MAQTRIRSQHKITIQFLRGAQRVCRKSVRWQRTTHGWQLTLRRTATPFETITQLSLSVKWHIRPNCCTSWKKIRTQWLRKRWGADNTHNDSRTPKLQSTNHWASKNAIIVKNQATLSETCRKRMRKEQEQGNDLSIQNTKPSTSKPFSPCPHCQRTNHPPEKCWSGPKAANRPKRFKQEYPADNRNDGQVQGSLTYAGPSSILKNPLN